MSALAEAAAHAESDFQQGLGLHRLGHLDQARMHYQRVLQVLPRHVRALHLLGVLEIQSNRPERAVELLGKALVVDPSDPAIHIGYGAAQYALKRYEVAIASYDDSIALKPDSTDAHFNRGNALRALNQHAAAVLSYDKALALSPRNPLAHGYRGIALFELGQFEAAVASFDRAIELKPEYAAAHYDRGNSLLRLRQFEAALASYDKAIALDAGYANAHLNRGIALFSLRRFDAAIASYDQVLGINPACAAAHNNRGSVLQELHRYQDANDSYDQAIALLPDHAEAYYNRGNVLREQKQYALAIESYDQAIALQADRRSPYAVRLNAKMHICDWNGFEDEVAELGSAIERDQAISNPFFILSLSDSAQWQKKAAEIWVREQHPMDRTLPSIPRRGRHDRIRIGYFSADLRDHAVAFLISELFELHDRSRFELTAFSFGPDTRDATRKRLENAFDRFIDVRARSDQDCALLARSLEIDVAVDLAGFTQYCRPGIFALRAAPLQVNFLGYPGTMGAEYMDYLVADRTLVPEGCEQHYSEKIIFLPNSYQPNDSKRRIADTCYTREQLGLPDTGFVFCCFNNNFKITPGTFDSWMAVLAQVQGSVLWLLQDNTGAASNLRREAVRRGVHSDRLIFAERMVMAEHLARQRVADLFLDTLPYNGHTTASDALWAGLPVLTCVGEAFASRVAASLLNAMRMPELITTTSGQYERMAVDLATDPLRLSAIRRKLAHNRLAAPLFDTRLYTKHIETAYIAICERYHSDQALDHLYPPAD